MTTTRYESIRLKALCVALVAVYPALALAGVAGHVQFVAGDVRVTDEKGKEHALRKGEEVSEGDTLRSGANGSAQLKMIDGAMVALRPGTELKVIDYVFSDEDGGKEKASFSLVKGGLRAVTGLIGRVNKDRYKIETPTAVIGIRGTDHEPVVVLPSAAGAGTPAGTYDKVNVGATTLTNQAGMAVVAANQVGFAASPMNQPVILPKIPDFYRATPAPKQEQKQEREEKKEQTAAKQESGTGGDSASSDTKAASTSAATSATATTSTASAATLTGADANGNTLNLSSQVLTTSSGQSLNLNGDALNIPTQPAIPHTQVIATFPVVVQGSGTQPGQSFSYPGVYYFGGPASSVQRDAAGNITGVNDNGADVIDYRSSLSQSGSTMADLGKAATGGVSWGRWQGGQVTQTSQYLGMDASGKFGLGAYDASGNFVVGGTSTTVSALGSGSLHWIAGDVAAPVHLTQVLTGTANYSLAGGTRPTDQQGNVGTLNSASLHVNFGTQLARANVNLSIAGDSWGMQSGDMLLNGPHFNDYSVCSSTSCTSGVSVTKNGVAMSTTGTPTTGFAFGHIDGSLLGSGLASAALQYSIQTATPTTQVDSASGQSYTTFTNNLIQGVAGFTGPAQDVNTPFRAVGLTDGWSNSYGIKSDSLIMNDPTVYRGSIEASEAPASRVVIGADGLNEFLGVASGLTPVGGGSAAQDTAATIKIGSAMNRDTGSATIGGATVSWGRWEGGSIDIYSRDGAVRLGTIDNSGRSVHWIASPVLTSMDTFTSLPLTGTATYTLAGATSPTDFKGNTGTLNSVTLSADFTNARVNAGVNVSFNAPTNSSNWTMNATNVPLKPGDGFNSSTMLNGVNGITHTASCSGPSCGAQTIGSIDGVLVGGAQGAVVMYNMATGSTTTSTTSPGSSTFTPVNAVTGLAVMKR
ncbi:MAG TPA: FecR family protein [Noviherbaspirillum sp.]|uniref:FecR family protein n=1 Tax=Noviherbaspirillum sp. TaxID=1926288 RepID=UPI002B49A343|nr:FecR family protein [Noviherbaspirillum sp.]HJV85602.1 FecR family protein [Noviherbaspirillum sp.]